MNLGTIQVQKRKDGTILIQDEKDKIILTAKQARALADVLIAANR